MIAKLDFSDSGGFCGWCKINKETFPAKAFWGAYQAIYHRDTESTRVPAAQCRQSLKSGFLGFLSVSVVKFFAQHHELDSLGAQPQKTSEPEVFIKISWRSSPLRGSIIQSVR